MKDPAHTKLFFRLPNSQAFVFLPPDTEYIQILFSSLVQTLSEIGDPQP
jgi:hypothetical protein